MYRFTSACLLAVTVSASSTNASTEYWERDGGVTFSTQFTDIAGAITEGGDYFGPFTVGSPDPREELINGNIIASPGGGHTTVSCFLGSWADIDLVVNIADAGALYPSTTGSNAFIYGFGDDLSDFSGQCDVAFECVVYLFGSSTLSREFQVPDDEYFYHAFESSDGRKGFMQFHFNTVTTPNGSGGTTTTTEMVRDGWALWDADATDEFVAFDVNQGLYCSADIDLDTDVDLGDFGVFGAAFGSVEGDSNWDPRCDFDEDGDVDLGDFGIFGSEFGNDRVACRGF